MRVEIDCPSRRHALGLSHSFHLFESDLRVHCWSHTRDRPKLTFLVYNLQDLIAAGSFVTETSAVAQNKIKSSRNEVVDCFLSIFFFQEVDGAARGRSGYKAGRQ